MPVLPQDEHRWHREYFAAHSGRYRETLSMIRSTYTGGTIVDIGALPGHMLFLLNAIGISAVGIDRAPWRCATFIQQQDLTIHRCDIEQQSLPFEENSVQYIVFTEVFEHLRINPIATLRDIYRILAPGGTLLVTTPNLYALRNIVSFVTGRGIGDPYEEFRKLETVGHMGHVREYAPCEMRTFLERAGFTVQDVQMRAFEKSRRKIVGPLVNILNMLVPPIRPTQVIICTKSN